MVLNAYAESLAAATAGYKQNVYAVNALANAVFSSSLPNITVKPQVWQSYINAKEQAGAAAEVWVNDVVLVS